MSNDTELCQLVILYSRFFSTEPTKQGAAHCFMDACLVILKRNCLLLSTFLVWSYSLGRLFYFCFIIFDRVHHAGLSNLGVLKLHSDSFEEQLWDEEEEFQKLKSSWAQEIWTLPSGMPLVRISTSLKDLCYKIAKNFRKFLRILQTDIHWRWLKCVGVKNLQKSEQLRLVKKMGISKSL